MDIKHLHYFVAVVETNCNLVEASKKNFVSQPALSQMINQFEKEHKVALFERAKNRLQGLTPAGELFYDQAKSLLAQHAHMMEELQSNAYDIKGKVRIGIPPFVLSTVLSSIMVSLILDNPGIHFDIVEIGAFDLRNMLILKEIDVAALLVPTNLKPDVFQQESLCVDSFAAFMDCDNPLATLQQLNWSDLDGQSLAMVDKTFMSHYQLLDTFAKHQVKPQVRFTSTNWDLILTSVMGSQLINLIPGVVSDYFQNPRIVKRTFYTPLSWQVVLCRNHKLNHTRAKEHVFQTILSHFRE